MISYFKEIKKVYGYKLIIKLSILLVFIVIFLDKINLFTKLMKLNYLWLLVLGVIFFLIKPLNKKTLKMLTLKSTSILDVILVSVFISEGVLLLYLFTTFENNYKFTFVYVLMILTIFFIIMRIFITNNKFQKNKPTVIDLQKIYLNKINIEKNNIVLLEEAEVSYDLLDRQSVINQLYNTIINCYPSRTFTIGLNGQWGSGKTTIINNVLKIIKDNNIEDLFVIVRFDPWEYNDERAMLKGLIEQIMINIDLNPEIEDLDQLVNSIIDVVFYDSKNFFKSILNSGIKNIRSKIKVENIINNYLLKHGKRMILIIDNLDRIDSNKIKFMLKIIASTLNLTNTINILLYDNSIIQKELDKCFGTAGLNVKYMDKIVQLKIDVPEIDSNQIEKLKNAVSNNLMYDNEPIIQKELLSNLMFNDVRELKRFINNILSSLTSSNILLTDNRVDNSNTFDFLNKNDLINLEFIRSKNPKLYYDIWENKNFYISDDRKYDTDLYTLDYNRLNKSAKEYFEQLFSLDENKKFLDILTLLFPNVRKYKKGQDIFNSHYNDKEQYKRGVIENRIYNTRYFDLYFTKNSNDFIRINTDVASLIQVIGNSKSESNIFKELETLRLKYNYDELKVFVEVLEMNVEKIEKSKYSIVINSLYRLLDNLPSIPYFFEIDARQRTIIIIANILNNISVDDMIIFCNKFANDTNKINDINQILYWMRNGQNSNDKNINKLEEAYKSRCQNIINNNIDLYSDDNYSYGNIWGLYHYDKDKVVSYIKNIICDKYVFRLLNDIISRSIGTNGYGYSIRKENIEALAPNIDIDELIKKRGTDLSTDDKFIKEIYEHYKFKKDDFNDAIYTIEPKFINKI